MHLIVSLSKIDRPIYQEENSSQSQKCSRNYSLVSKTRLKFLGAFIVNLKQLSKLVLELFSCSMESVAL